MNCNEEFVIKAIGKLTLEFDYDWSIQRRIRDLLYEALYNYQVLAIETSLVASDIEEKVMIYLQCKKIEGKSESTIRNYLYILMRLASYLHKPISTISIMDLRMFIANTTTEFAPSTVNTVISVIKSFFSWLEQEEYIPKNSAKKLNLSKLPKRLRKSLNVEELERLRDSCKTLRERAILELFFSTGCRVSEVENINVSDLNFNSNSITVIGKGNKERIVYFSPKAKIYIEKYLSTRNDVNPALFVSIRSPFNRLGRRALEKEISLLGKRAGFDKPIFCHLLRHTMATLGLKAGADLITIQYLLGHEDPATTQIYAELDSENVKHSYNQHLIH